MRVFEQQLVIIVASLLISKSFAFVPYRYHHQPSCAHPLSNCCRRSLPSYRAYSLPSSREENNEEYARCGNANESLLILPESIGTEGAKRETSRRSFVTAVVASASAAIITSNPEPSNANADVADSATIPVKKTSLTAKQIFEKSKKKALSGGKAGATASIFQVLGLMWLRTSMNYQYRYGGTLSSSLSELYSEGGVPRLYQGLPFALIQGPLTRFGDTAANVGILALMDSIPELEGLPLPVKTAVGSVCAGVWRIFLMPVDTSKTVLQVEGKDGLGTLVENVKENGIAPLYRGAIASASASAVGNFPWFTTYNYLDDVLPVVQASGGSGGELEANLILLKLARSAFLGLSASCASDVCSNSLRVLKTTKQTAGLKDNGEEYSYRDTLNIVLEKDGWSGLFGRGLQTRLLTNALQGAVFSVLWRYFQEVQAIQ